MRKMKKAVLLVLVMMLALVPSAFAQDYAYTIENVYFTDLTGTAIENPAKSCVVNVDVKKHKIRLGKDVIVIVGYSTDGNMIEFTTISGNMGRGDTSTFSTLVTSPSDKSIGVIKAYVWNNIAEMEPLSLVSQTIVNEMDPGVYLPPVNEEPTEERYIPKTITVRGFIEETPLSNTGLEHDEYRISNFRIPRDIDSYDDIYTEEEFFAFNTRYNAIASVYAMPGSYSAIRVLSEVDLNDFLFHEMDFEIKMDGDRNYVIIDAEPRFETVTCETVDAADYVMQADLADVNQYRLADYTTGTASNNKIKFGSKYYTLADSVAVYVNGAYVETITNVVDVVGTGAANLTTAQADLDKYLGGAMGSVKLLDNDTNAKDYDVIMVDVWNVAKVLGVDYENGRTTVTITTKSYLAGAAAYEVIIIDDQYIEEGDTVVTVEKNGEPAELTSIAKGDIIAYKTEIGCSSALIIENPRKIEILATNETMTGRVKRADLDAEIYSIDGTTYECVVFGSPLLSVGKDYKFVLDPFGRIYSAYLINTDGDAVENTYAEVATKFNANSRFAVVRKAPVSMETDNGDIVDAVTVLLDGETEKELYFEKNVFSQHALSVGDAFFYQVNTAGYVADVFQIYDSSTMTFVDLATAISAGGKNRADYIETVATKADSWDFTLINSGKADIQLVEGYVIPDIAGVMSFAEVVSPLTKVDTTKDHTESGDNGVAIFAVTDDTEAYLYDKSNITLVKEYDKFSIKADTSLLASTALAKYEKDGVYDIANVSWITDLANEANYAVAMIVDEEVVQVYVVK